MICSYRDSKIETHSISSDSCLLEYTRDACRDIAIDSWSCRISPLVLAVLQGCFFAWPDFSEVAGIGMCAGGKLWCGVGVGGGYVRDGGMGGLFFKCAFYA